MSEASIRDDLDDERAVAPGTCPRYREDALVKLRGVLAPATLAHYEWNKASEKVGVRGVAFQQGTRHTTLTALSQELPERVLRQFSRHRSYQSLDHYTRPRATPAAIIRVLRPSRSTAP